MSGGAIYNKDGNITITGSQFDQNSSGSMGGAIANMSGRTDYTGEINITYSGFTGNKAGNGGAVWNEWQSQYHQQHLLQKHGNAGRPYPSAGRRHHQWWQDDHHGFHL
jgi:hypothetical protein